MKTESKTFSHFRTCNLCEAICGLEIIIENNRIKAIKGDEKDPFSKGHICPKAVALQDIYSDSDRLKRPVKRQGDKWIEITWNEAFDEVVYNLKEIQKKYGRNSVGIYQGNPTVHNSGTMLSAPEFFKTLKTKNRFSATSADQLPHQLTSFFMFGSQLLLPVPDIDRTEYFLIIGANPFASNGSMMTAPGFANRLKQLQKRGGKFVVIDPRFTETAEAANSHYFITPGTDVYFLLALLNAIINNNFIKLGKLENIVEGFDKLKNLVADFSPESVETKTGISSTSIKKIAEEFCKANSAVCYGRFGVSTQAYGSSCQWLINVINIVTGNFDSPGGAMFALPAIDIVMKSAKDGRTGHFAKWKSRVNGLPEFSGELPVAALADEILTEGNDQIKALITSAGNPALSTPNGTKLQKALAKLKFMVSIDIYINETTKFANIILPPATGLETDHYDLIFHLLAVRNTAKYSKALFKPEKGSLYDWQIFNELTKRMIDNSKKKKIFSFSNILKKFLTPERIIDLGLRLGPYGIWGGKFLSKDGLSLRKLKKNVHGIDLGPLKESLPERLLTKNKKVILVPEIFEKDIEQIKNNYSAPSTAANSNLLLIGRRHLRSNNSWMHNFHRLVKGNNRCTLLINKIDASSRNIKDNQLVEVKSSTGKILIIAEITDKIMPGVVSIPHGWGHNLNGIKLSVAKNFSGVSINDLTDEKQTDSISGNAAFSGVFVNVSPIK